MTRLLLLFALISAALALVGPAGYGLWGWWGCAAYLLGAFLSVGFWALGLIGRLPAIEHYSRLHPHLTQATEALAVARVFLPFLRAVSAVLAGLAISSWLIRKRRLLHGLVLAAVAVIALGGPLIWLAVEHQPRSSANLTLAAVPTAVMLVWFSARRRRSAR